MKKFEKLTTSEIAVFMEKLSGQIQYINGVLTNLQELKNMGRSKEFDFTGKRHFLEEKKKETIELHQELHKELDARMKKKGLYDCERKKLDNIGREAYDEYLRVKALSETGQAIMGKT